MQLIVAPEPTGEEYQDTQDLQTTNEHQEGTCPLDIVGQLAPRHLRTYLRAEGRTYVADATQGDGDGVGIVDTCRYHDGG